MTRKASQRFHDLDQFSAAVSIPDRCPLASDVPPDDRRAIRPSICLASPSTRSSEKPKRLADVANGGTHPIGDHRRGQPSAVTAVLVVEILQHFFPTLVLEIHVDVGRFVAFATDKSLEQHVGMFRVDGRDAQAVTDGRIGRGAAALTQNVALASEPYQIPDGQKVSFVAQFFDQRSTRARSIGVRVRGYRPGNDDERLPT